MVITKGKKNLAYVTCSANKDCNLTKSMFGPVIAHVSRQAADIIIQIARWSAERRSDSTPLVVVS